MMAFELLSTGREIFAENMMMRLLRARMMGLFAGLAVAGFAGGAERSSEGEWLFLGGKSGFEIREARWMEAFLRQARPELADRVRWGVQPYVTAAEIAEWERKLFRSPGVAGAARAVWFLGGEEVGDDSFDREKAVKRWSGLFEKWKAIRGERVAEDVVMGPGRTLAMGADLEGRRGEVSAVLRGVAEGSGMKYLDMGELVGDLAGNVGVATVLVPRGEVTEGGNAYWTGRGFLTEEGQRLVGKRLVTALTGRPFFNTAKAQVTREGMGRGEYDAGGWVRFIEMRPAFTGLIGVGLFDGRGLPDLGDGPKSGREQVTFGAVQTKTVPDGSFLRRYDAASGVRVSILANSVRFPALDGAYRCVRDRMGRWVFLVRSSDDEVRLVALTDRGDGGALDGGRVLSKRVLEPSGMWADGGAVVLAERGGFFRYTPRQGDMEEARREPLAMGEGWAWRGDDAGGRPVMQRGGEGFAGWIYGWRGGRVSGLFSRFGLGSFGFVSMVPRALEHDRQARVVSDSLGNLAVFGNGDESVRLGSRGLGMGHGTSGEKASRPFGLMRRLPPEVAVARWAAGGGAAPVAPGRLLVAGWGEMNGVWAMELKDSDGVAGVASVERVINWGDRGYRPVDMTVEPDGAVVLLLSRKGTLEEIPPAEVDAHTLLVRLTGSGKGGKVRSEVVDVWGQTGDAVAVNWESGDEGEVLEGLWASGGALAARKGEINRVAESKDFRVRSGLARWVAERVLGGEWDASLLGRLAADGSEFVRQELFEMALRLPSSRVRESVGILEGLMGGGTHDGFRGEVYPEWRKRQSGKDRWKVPADLELRRYVFGLTSDADLERMEVGLAVYEEAVGRAGVSDGFRRKAFVEVARARGTLFAEEVMRVVGDRVGKGEGAMRFQARLLGMIAERDAKELEAVRGGVVKFTEATLPELRRAALGILVSAEGVDAVWRRVEGSLSKEEEILSLLVAREAGDWAERGRDWVVGQLGLGTLTRERARKLFVVLARTNGRFARANAPIFLREAMGKRPLEAAVEGLKSISAEGRRGSLELGDLVRYARAWRPDGESEDVRRARAVLVLVAREMGLAEADAIAEYLNR
jgi:hypothetical protein